MQRKVYVVLHSESTTMGTTAQWIRSRKLASETLVAPSVRGWPNLSANDAVIVLGGDMQAWEIEENPWLLSEKAFLRQALEKEVPIFGVCLGGQLLAEQLGAELIPSDKWEFGWFPVLLDHCAQEKRVFKPFHCNSSGFQIPPGAEKIASGEHFLNQGFALKNCYGFQFHTEIDFIRLFRAIRNWDSDRKGWLQTRPCALVSGLFFMRPLREFYFEKLDAWLNQH